MAEIVDNSPELDLNDPKTQEILQGVTGEDKGVKEEAKVSPALEPEVKRGEEAAEGEGDVEHLKSQIRGLKAELTRRSGNAERVEDLESRLAQAEQKLAETPKPTADPITEAIRKLDDRALIDKQTDWEDELAAARAKYERADETQNTESMRAAGERIAHAKRVLSALKSEASDRVERRSTERNQLQQEAEQINGELSEMYESVSEAFPDFTNQDSELWKAGNEEFLAHPALMRRLGAAGEVVAAALAVVKNPQLTKGTSAQARREVISKIDKGFGKALQAGTSSPNFSRNTDYAAAIADGEGLDKFNKMIDKIKGG